MSSPSIVFIQKYHQYFDSNFALSAKYKQSPEKYNLYIKTSNFYRCKDSTFDITKYLSRNEACDKTSLDNELMRERFQKAKVDFSNYMGERYGSTGLFSMNGDLDQNQMEKIKDELRIIKTNVYECVLSFTPEFSKKNLNSKIQAYELLKKVLPKYFQNNSIDPNNINWFAAYHTNTDNRHIHLIWYEKTPTKINEKGKPIELKFKEKDLTKMKTLIEMNTQPVLYKYETLRNPVLNKASDFILENPNDENVKKLKEVFKNTKTRQYYRLTAENKKKVRDFTQALNRTCPEFHKSYMDYNNALEKTQESLLNIYKENNIDPSNIPQETYNFVHNRLVELSTRIYNKVLKTAYFALPLNKKEKPKSFYSQLKYNRAKSCYKASVKENCRRNIKDNELQYTNDVFTVISKTQLKHQDTLFNFIQQDYSPCKYPKKMSDTDRYASSLIRNALPKAYRLTSMFAVNIFRNIDNKWHNITKAPSLYAPSSSSASVADALWAEANKKAEEEKEKSKLEEEQYIHHNDDLER